MALFAKILSLPIVMFDNWIQPIKAMALNHPIDIPGIDSETCNCFIHCNEVGHSLNELDDYFQVLVNAVLQEIDGHMSVKQKNYIVGHRRTGVGSTVFSPYTSPFLIRCPDEVKNA